MANGVQLATAYISLNVRTDDIKKQVQSALDGAGRSGAAAGTSIGRSISNSIRSHLGSVGTLVFAPMEVAGVRWAVKAGAAIGGALKTAIMGAIGGLGIGALFGVGGVLTAGLDRLKTIQRAQVQLSLKLDPNEIKRVTKDIQDVVRGTPIALDEALQSVPRALSAGIKPGQELSQYVKDIADAAASTGGQAGFGQIDIIFSQILGKGKLMGEELMQLTENGVDLRSALKDAFNWDDKTLNKNIEKGKVGMKEVQRAVEATWGKDGGLAKKMGGTFDGAMGNLKASVARLGANILGTIFGDPNNPDGDPLKGAIDGVTALTGKLDTAGKWVATHREEIRGYFNGAKDTAVSLVDKIKEVVAWLSRTWTSAEELGSKISGAFDKGRNAVGNMWTKTSEVFGKIKSKISEIVDDLKKKFDGIFGAEGWFAKQFDRLGQIVDKVRDVLGLGEATANAAAPGAAPFNPGPKATLAPLPNTPPGYTRSFGTPSGGYNAKGEWVGPGFPAAAPAAASNAARIPYGLPAGTNTGGYGTGNAKTFPEWVMQIADTFGIKPSTYSGHQADNRQEAGYAPNPNNQNRGIDWTGPVENLQKFADYLASIPQDMEQVIWQNPNTKRKTGIAGGRDVSGTGYYDDKTYAAHGGNDPNNIHVHTRQSMSIPAPITLSDLLGGGNNFVSGGDIRGAGTGTSDSIPAMLSNGEHVLTAADVKAMGGQQNVYAFRSALQNGLIPGFAPGGAVDPNDPSVTNRIADLNNAAVVAQQRFNETMNNADATDKDKLSATIDMQRTQRELGQYQADLPLITSGLTPPDRSAQNRVLDLTDQLALADQAMKDQKASGNDIPLSQQTQSQYQLDSLKRERGQAINDLTGGGKKPDYGMDFIRSMGFVPAAAGSSAKAGTSSLASFIDMGASITGGIIDTGTSLAQTAVSAAITAGAAAGTFGAGAAAAPAASAAAGYGINLLGNMGKTTANYWFGLAGIGADALMEQFSPFGSPRWLGYDYTQFAPQLGLQQAFSSSIEKMGGDAIKNAFGQGSQNPNIPPDPTATPGNTNTAPSGPAAGSMSMSTAGPAQQKATIAPDSAAMGNTGTVDLAPITPFNPNEAGGSGGGGSWARGGAIGIYDNGGVLRPGELALNASRTPESILTKAQWTAMSDNASTQSSNNAPLVGNLYAQDMQDAIRQLDKVKKRDMMQYSGRS